MNKETVDKLMGSYLEDKARCTYLDTMIVMEQYYADKMRSHIVEDMVSVGGQDMDGMPHSTDVHSQVERLAISIADGYVPDYIKEAEKNLSDMRQEYNQKLIGVLLVEGWLKALAEDGKERFVIWNKMIEGKSWNELIFAYNRKYGTEYSKNGLALIRDKGMEKIYRVAA